MSCVEGGGVGGYRSLCQGDLDLIEASCSRGETVLKDRRRGQSYLQTSGSWRSTGGGGDGCDGGDGGGYVVSQ